MRAMVDRIKVGIRADGNAHIGMGHLMRCVSIAKALQKQNVECVFFTAESKSGLFLEERGFVCHVLETDYRHMESELPQLLQVLKVQKISLLLVDSYQMTQPYLDGLMKYCPVYYLDDMGNSGLKADGIINYNIYGPDLDYECWCPAGTELYLGAKFAPIKEEFSKVCYEVSREVTRILITMGGSDTLNIAGSLGRRLLNCLPETIEIHIICGRFNPHLKALERLQENHPRVHIHVDVQDMWNEMALADIAVSAAGSTMYELSTIGVPSVCCYYVENQRQIAESFSEKVQVLNGGDFSQDPQRVLEKMTEEVCSLAASWSERKELSLRMKKITDGRGAERIAENLKRKLENMSLEGK